MRHLDLFSGIGGFALAARWMGWETIQFVEMNDFCQKVLNKHWPNVPIHGDIKTFNGSKLRGTVDILTGGFPCQPFSTAGSRKGKEDDRYLWPEMLRVISDVKPTYVVGENVAGILSMEDGQTFERILSELECIGYTIETFVVPACGVGAWHRRDRTWIVAYSNNCLHKGRMGNRGNTSSTKGGERTNGIKRQTPHRKRIRVESCSGGKTFTDTNGQRCGQVEQSIIEGKVGEETASENKHGSITDGGSWWKTEPSVDRVVDGIPNRVDRIRGLGNAIVPQIALEIFKAIEAVNNSV